MLHVCNTYRCHHGSPQTLSISQDQTHACEQQNKGERFTVNSNIYGEERGGRCPTLPTCSGNIAEDKLPIVRKILQGCCQVTSVYFKDLLFCICHVPRAARKERYIKHVNELLPFVACASSGHLFVTNSLHGLRVRHMWWHAGSHTAAHRIGAEA